jgi:hypothetical protein
VSTEVGWKWLEWSGDPIPCAVPRCARPVHAGRVRVDRQEPAGRHFAVICVDCWALIMAGSDPGGDELPEWERRRRDEDE